MLMFTTSTLLWQDVNDICARTEEAIYTPAGSLKSSTRAHTAAQSAVLRLSGEFVDNRIIPKGCDSIDSFAEIYEKVRCA